MITAAIKTSVCTNGFATSHNLPSLKGLKPITYWLKGCFPSNVQHPGNAKGP